MPRPGWWDEGYHIAQAVKFIARCPACGQDVWWTETRYEKGTLFSYLVDYEVACRCALAAA